MYSDDPNDKGIAGVDLFRFNPDEKVVEHCDVLQEVERNAAGEKDTPFDVDDLFR